MMKSIVPRRFKLGGGLLDGFDSFFRPVFEDSELYMRCDVKEEGSDHFSIEAELPGVKKEDIDVSLKDGYLTISAQKKEAEEVSTDSYIRREIKYGSSSRSFFIGYNVDETDIVAGFENGILKLKFPRDKGGKNDGKRIAIN
ncbi:MAG: Hsp20/alpha crystallin family protein [Christensenellaceae bacterium]|nr:Hsp20/alpha crystallin family protein [Christensenellaceae bacterium]